MVKVNVTTYGSVNKEAGWSCQEVELEQERVTIEDVLRSAELGDGRSLFDLVADESGIKERYTILLNGRPLWNPRDLKVEITGRDQVTALDILYALGGGSGLKKSLIGGNYEVCYRHRYRGNIH